MPRLFIADSEDEDEGASPESPAPVPLPPLFKGQSSDPLSRGTDSTDIAFFKSVYQEQTQAIAERTRNDRKQEHLAPSKPVPRGGGMWDVPSSPDPQPASSRRKRRKLSHEELGSPESVEGRAAGASSSPSRPTLQIDNEAAFVITPNNMTKSQCEEYQAVNYDSSIDPERISTLQAHGQRLLDLTSSSSGTHMNTPRTVGALTQLANTQDLPPTAPFETIQEEEPTQAAAAALPAPRLRRFSSPDVIAVAETTDLQSQFHEPTGDEEDIRATAFSAHDEPELEEYHEPTIIEDEDSPFEEGPVKPKKKRGRPKKIKVEESVAVAEPEPMEPAASEKPAKKKRGRPRKEKTTPEKAAQLPADEAPGLVEPKESRNNDTKAVKKNEPTKAAHEEVQQQAEELRESPQSLKDHDSKADTEKEKSVKMDETQQSSGTIEGKALRVGDGKSLQYGVKDDGRPVYRIGLSKRTRIAPLLKIIRK